MLIESALVVATQVLILFLLIGIGFFMAKIKWLDDAGIRQMTQLLLMIKTPCLPCARKTRGSFLLRPMLAPGTPL